MKALKTLVIVMGILILAGIAVIGVTLYNRANRPGGLAGAPPAAAPADRIADGSLGLPAGSRIRGLAGAGGRVVVHVELPSGAEELVILDPASGAVVGRLGVADRAD